MAGDINVQSFVARLKVWAHTENDFKTFFPNIKKKKKKQHKFRQNQLANIVWYMQVIFPLTVKTKPWDDGRDERSDSDESQGWQNATRSQDLGFGRRGGLGWGMDELKSDMY